MAKIITAICVKKQESLIYTNRVYHDVHIKKAV